jgi:hypothetical protein
MWENLIPGGKDLTKVTSKNRMRTLLQSFVQSSWKSTKSKYEEIVLNKTGNACTVSGEKMIADTYRFDGGNNKRNNDYNNGSYYNGNWFFFILF